jgi:Sec-independent protein translocase protein TatA
MGKAIRNFKRGLEEHDETNVTPDERQVSSTSSAQSLDASQKAHANSKS